MRRWLALAPYDDEGNMVESVSDGRQLEAIADFRSGDGERPEQGDLNEALEDVLPRHFNGSIVLVPLDSALTLHIQMRTQVDIVASGNLV